jgi:hypothetical protein
MYRTQAGLVCHRNPDETVRSVDRSTALRLNTGVHAKHPGQLRLMLLQKIALVAFLRHSKLKMASLKI